MSLRVTMMDATAVIYRPAIGQNPDYSTLQNFQVYKRNLACSWQEASANVQAMWAQRNAYVSTTVYFADVNPLTEPNDLIFVTRQRTGETAYLLVEGEAESDTHGRLWQVPCRRIRQPGPG
jgi:hypothetical protein